jgi:hypothetical protein
MKGGAPVALALGVGYILGRRRKMRLATMLAVGAATGGIGGLGPAVLKRGVKYLGSSDLAGDLGPQVTDIVSTIRGDLLDAGKAAAAAAVTSRMDSLTDSLHQRAETLRNPEAAVSDAADAVGGVAGSSVGRAGGAAGKAAGRAGGSAGGSVGSSAGSPAGSSVGRAGGRLRRRGREEPDDVEEPEDEYEDEPYEDEPEEPEEAEYSDDEDSDSAEPAPRRTRGTRSPVSRTRR